MNNTLSKEAYQQLRTRIDAYEAWRNGRTSVKVSDIPAGMDVTNKERGMVEVYEFINNPPDRYFAYVRRVDTQGNPSPTSLRVQITTWMGDVLGHGILGQQYQSPGFWRKSTRYPVLKFKAINGKSYFGTYFASAGDYCRLKLGK